MREIFVFGSNLAGRHGKGAALTAVRQHGAIRGQAEGLQGNSYAIPTKDFNLRVLDLWTIQRAIERFNRLTWSMQGQAVFQITAVGCGLAGYRSEQIAPMFVPACPINTNWDPKFDMFWFDGLPEPVRMALRKTVNHWHSQAARQALDQGMSVSRLVELIPQIDAKFVAQTGVLN